MSRPLRRPGRTPGSVNLGIAIAVLAVLLPLLLNAATAAPPTAAEFSPNAQQVIKKAPPGQAAAVNGSGENGPDGAGTATPTPTPTPTPTSTGSGPPENEVKHCVGPPPLRQIEDPQSPPCIAYWKGDNGGATSRGVTRESIYIAIPTPENANSAFAALETFFNKRFQLYGRKLVFEYCGSSGGGSGSSDEKNQQADAAMAAAGCENKPPPFASTFYRQNNGAYYMPTMACRYKTIVVGSYSPYDKAFLDRCAPYQYQYPMVVDEQLANLGEWSCNRLAGRTARWAEGSDGSTPGKELSTQQRKFGVLLEPFTDDDPVARRSVLTPLLARLKACGSPVADADVLVNPVPKNNFDPSSAQNTMLQMKQHNITSVICLCNFFSLGTLQRAAETNSYRPEWVSSTFGLSDVNSSFILAQGPGSQMRHTFGLTFHPRMVSPLLNPYNTAIQEGDPSVAPDTTTTGEAKLEVYRALLLLASGIQMAGPHLTVQSFRDGLRDTAFPNPDTPLKAGAVDFRADGYSMTADGAEWWYSTSANGPFTDSAARTGTVCYLDRGVRHKLGSWPRGEAPFFNGKCYSGG